MIPKTEVAKKADEKLWGRSKYAREIKKTFELLDQEAEKRLVAADQAYTGGDYLAALKRYLLLRRAMLPRQAGVIADKRLKSAENNPSVQMAMKEARAQDVYASVAALLKRQQDRINRGAHTGASGGQAAPEPGATSDLERIRQMKVADQAKVLKQLALVAKHHAGTPTGKKGAALLKQIKADKKLWAVIRNHRTDMKVRQQFDKAQMYEKARMYRKAAQYYREFVEKHPDSPYAGQARQRLAMLNGRGE